MDSKKIAYFATQYIHVYSEGIDELGDMTDEEHICGLIIAAYRWANLHDIDPSGLMGAVMAMKDLAENQD